MEKLPASQTVPPRLDPHSLVIPTAVKLARALISARVGRRDLVLLNAWIAHKSALPFLRSEPFLPILFGSSRRSQRQQRKRAAN